MKRTTYAIRGNSKYSIEIPAQPSKLREKRRQHRVQTIINRNWRRYGLENNTDNSFNMSEGEE